MHKLAGLCLVLAAALAAPACDQPQTPTTLEREAAPLPSLAPVVEKVLPAIVNISVTRDLSNTESALLADPELRKYFDVPDELPEDQTEAVGSGVVIDPKAGLILTNNHVIEQANEIVITLGDGTELKPRRILADSGTDLALIEVEVPPGVELQTLAWGDPDQLLPGDHVVAIGSPFGLDQSVSAGVVSALGRTGLGLQGYENFIQTDAPVNPGSSGGALVNLRGELVGINNVILSPGGGNIGIAFAIPSDMVRNVIVQLLETGTVTRGRLGATVRDLTPALSKKRGSEGIRGVLVVAVQPDSPAAKAGLQRGDIITAVDGAPVERAGRLRTHIAFEAVGKKVRLSVYRDGKQFEISPRIEAHSADAEEAEIEHAALENSPPGAVRW